MFEQIKFLPVKKLKPHGKNPRDITSEALTRLKKSLKEDPEFFKIRPCLVNKTNGKLLVYAGQQRLRASIEMGKKKVPCIVSKDVTAKRMKIRMLQDNIHDGVWNQEMLMEGFTPEKLKKLGLDEKTAGFKFKDAAKIKEKDFSDGIETEHKCPKCGYEF